MRSSGESSMGIEPGGWSVGDEVGARLVGRGLRPHRGTGHYSKGNGKPWKGS